MERRRDRVGNRRGVNDRDALGHRKEIPRREREVFGVAAIGGHADLPAQAAAERLVREAAEITVVAKEIEVAHHALPRGGRGGGRADLGDGAGGPVAPGGGGVPPPAGGGGRPLSWYRGA